MSEKVEYITKTVYNIARNFKLKHQVKFGSADSAKQRKDPVYASVYTSQQYLHEEDLMSIIIDTSDYLIMDYRESKDKNISIYLSYPHLYTMKRFLKSCLEWFYSAEYADMFIEKKNEIKFNSKYADVQESNSYTIDQKVVRIRPSIVERDDIYDEGVIMNLNDDYLVSLTVTELESLYNTISNFDLYQSSLILTHYVLTSHPEVLLSSQVSSTRRANTLSSSDVFKRKHKKKDPNTTK